MQKYNIKGSNKIGTRKMLILNRMDGREYIKKQHSSYYGLILWIVYKLWSILETPYNNYIENIIKKISLLHLIQEIGYSFGR